MLGKKFKISIIIFSTCITKNVYSEQKLSGSYCQSASYTIPQSNWDIFISADYLYWKWQQDSFQLGTQITANPDSIIPFEGDSSAVFQNPKYKSGFQVGIGLHNSQIDDWNIYSEYTWYTNSNTDHITGTYQNPFVISKSHFLQTDELIAAADFIGIVSTKATLRFQALDLLLQRPFYFGKKLIADYGIGLEAEWISQSVTSTSPYMISSENTVFVDHFYSENISSWGLGPKFSFTTNWLLGHGIKIIASLAKSVLYTSYQSSAITHNIINEISINGDLKYLRNYGTLRPVTESFLGLGYGSYVCQNTFHIDFSIGYDFNIYWNYNMLTCTLKQIIGNMYFHGLNIQARFDF